MHIKRLSVQDSARGACLIALALLLGCQMAPDPAPLARVSGGDTRRDSRVVDLPAGERVTLAELAGPGVIHHMWFTAMSDSPRVYAGLVLRIWWDGEPVPSVEVPMGDLFGVGFGEERDVRSAAIEMTPPGGLPNHAALNWWLPMPFESARLEIENQNDAPINLLFWHIDWERVEQLDPEHGRLHAQWRRSNPVERGRHHTALIAEGRGRYIGTVYSIHLLEPGSWVEGGDDFYIDLPEDEWAALEAWDRTLVIDSARRVPAEARSIANQPMGPVWPTLEGTGCEDFFCGAWGFHDPERSALLHGVSLGPTEDGRLTAYRFHLPDPIRFHERIRVIFRNHGWDVQARADDITTVAYWYQIEPHTPFPELPPVEERLPPPPPDTAGE
ncbi:DUF2961 domain-containing protein [Candidatus Sumerlaeota bacterium]|nr:DUF2961 domain-containing protein [Candidatus Sumerlaeota bacterium]